MATSPRQETAQIFQFPIRPRRSETDTRPPQQTSLAQQVVMSDFGSGWYHEAAMEQAEQTRKH